MAVAAAPAAASWIGPAIGAAGSVLGGLLGGGDEPKQSNELQSAVSTGTSLSSSNQSIAFEELFRSLYGDAFGGAAAVKANVPLFQGEAAQLFGGGSDFLKSLAGRGPGTDYLTSRLSGDDPALTAQLAELKSGLGDLFREEINPAITSKSIAAGTLGGGRQGVAQGIAAGKLGDVYQRGATSLLASAQGQRDTIASGLNTNATNAAAAGLAGLPNVLSLATSKATAPLMAQSLLQQILGGPTTLTTASGTSEQTSNQFGLTGRADLSKLIPIFQTLMQSGG